MQHGFALRRHGCKVVVIVSERKLTDHHLSSACTSYIAVPRIRRDASQLARLRAIFVTLVLEPLTWNRRVRTAADLRTTSHANC